ncbi:MAG: hypothetical protein KAY37_02555 [Phycisphaerae bacterium]|nr:hypothetical protein [Phycisphaerae bacterium]
MADTRDACSERIALHIHGLRGVSVNIVGGAGLRARQYGLLAAAEGRPTSLPTFLAPTRPAGSAPTRLTFVPRHTILTFVILVAMHNGKLGELNEDQHA